MARISSYPRDKEVQDDDSWIGTESSNRITRNFSAKAIAEYLNIKGKISISSQMVFQLDQATVNDGQFNGVFTGDAFSTASSLVISYRDMSTQEVVAFLDYLVGSEILISEQKEISNFGHYKITSYTLIPLTTTYTLNLTYIGGNGTFEDLKYYDFATFTKSDSVIPGTYTWTVSDGTNSTAVASGETVTFSGTANEIEVAESGKTVTIGLPDDVTITNDLTVLGAGNFTGQVTIPILPISSTDAASKDYVDNTVVGGLVYQGSYNAATNTPDLTTSPNSILKGWTYTVTVDGTFFGEQLRVGDVLIAEVDDPSALDDWTTVQNNIDLASLTQVGIGNVNAEPAGNLGGIAVSYNAGTAKVGLDIAALGVDPLAETPADYLIPIYNAADDENKKVTASDLLNAINSATSYATTITDTATITHNLDSKDVIIQLYDVITDETVYADVERVSTTQATITFATTPTNSVRVLVQKIG